MKAEDELPFAKPDELPAARCLPVLNLIWLCLLSIALLLLWSTSVENGAFDAQRNTDLGGPPNTSPQRHAHPFNVVLPRSQVRHGREFSMRVPSAGYLPIADMALVTHVYVCCRTDGSVELVCNAATAQLGATAVLRQERLSGKVYAVVQLQHTDMIGSKCTLYWRY